MQETLLVGLEPSSLAITLALATYVGVSLTIPFWVPIVKRLTGDCGVFWVCIEMDVWLDAQADAHLLGRHRCSRS